MLTHTACGEWIQACQCPPDAVSYSDRFVYWHDRYAELGAAAVLRRGDTAEQQAEFTLAHVERMLREIRAVVPPGGRVAELGCGWGRLLAPVQDAGFRAVGCDLSEAAVDHALSLGLIVRQGTVLPVPDGWADLVYTFTCLQHVGDVDLARCTAELTRAVKPGGIVLLVENTTEGASGIPWTTFRSPRAYAHAISEECIQDGEEHLELGFRNGQRHTLMRFRRYGG